MTRRDNSHMTSLFLREGVAHKIVTLSDMRGGGGVVTEKSDVTKNAIIYDAKNIVQRKKCHHKFW